MGCAGKVENRQSFALLFLITVNKPILMMMNPKINYHFLFPSSHFRLEEILFIAADCCWICLQNGDVQGFRKIDTDRWEFANEGFLRGNRHLLKNIHRRKSPSQQLGTYVGGPSVEPGNTELEGEIGKLKEERAILLHEVVDLQQQQCGTRQQMETVNQRLQVAEQKQKQMVSFLAKLLQNPGFVSRHGHKKGHKQVGSPRIKRKLIRQHPHELFEPEKSVEGQVVEYKYTSDLLNPTISLSDLKSEPVTQYPSDHHLQDMVGRLGLDTESMPFQFGHIASDELAHELTEPMDGTREGGLKLESFERTSGISPQELRPTSAEYSVSLPDDLVGGNIFPQFSSPGIESNSNQEEMWSSDFDTSAGMFGSSHELMGNLVSFDVLGVSPGLSDIWDIGPSQRAGDLGIDSQASFAQQPMDELEKQPAQAADTRSEDLDP